MGMVMMAWQLLLFLATCGQQRSRLRRCVC